MFHRPISQEVCEYQKGRTVPADGRARVRIAPDNGMRLWSLTTLLALLGQLIQHLYYKEGHRTAAAHKIAACCMGRLIADRLTERGQLVQAVAFN